MKQTTNELFYSKDLIKSFYEKPNLGGFTLGAGILFLTDLINSSKTSFFIVFEKESLAQKFFNKAKEHNNNFLYYPKSFNGEAVPGFNTEESTYRKEALINLATEKTFCCIGTKKSLEEEEIPKNIEKRLKEFRLNVGDNCDISELILFLQKTGYARTELVYEPGYYANRGDVVDIYPKHFKKPFRLSFDFDTVGSISTFNTLSQLTEKNHDFISLKEFSEESQVVDKISLISLFYVFDRYVCLSDSLGKVFFGDGDVYKFNNISALEVFIRKPSDVKENFGEDVSVFLAGGTEESLSWFEKKDFVKSVGFLNKSFYIKTFNLLVVSVLDIERETKPLRLKAQNNIDQLNKNSIAGLAIGDFIVHKSFGVGLFKGLVFRDEALRTGESVQIEYSKGSIVYVSLDQLSLVHQYVGTKRDPKISSLGSKRWNLELQKTKKAVRLFAKELISLYTEKNKKRGFSYVIENDLDGALSSSFSFIETPDQKKAIEDVFVDMNGQKPMDRLVCGDVGFGKTEVALRAIFKSCLSNKASILLCPTTILADQHYITCKERLEPLGVRVGLLSRFRSKKEQAKTLEGLKKGVVDVLVGTHRVLSGDVDIPNLSLLVIDEEHRFGVKHKEKIRSLKNHLDVLTLTATPIPRTLQQSLVGLRDLSTILTPPKSRRPILTSVRYFNWDLIFSTIEFELERGGQTYFLHNDIKSIPIIINKIKNRFKNVKIEGVSGKIPSKELEPIVLSFFSGKIDILVCTTIIESGLDVTNANTIIINNAQDFGLSQLYQIRGRVGRGEKQARCLLLVPQKQLSQDAHLRLKAVEENNALGSGYTLSVKDLEIRGAGSLFGYKQSGNISSVGFELYCEILQDEINLEKNQIEKRQDVIIFGDFLTEIGEKYVSNRSIRVDFYFQLSKTKTLSDLLRIKKSLIDRFGNLPVETERLFLFSHVKLIFRDSCINKIYIKDTSFSLTLSDLGVFKTLENLFSLLNSFKSENLNGFHYKKDTKGNLVIVFSVSGVERAFLLLFEIEPFFNDKNIS